MATYVILFAVGLSVVVGFILTFRDYFVKSSISLEERQEISRSKLQSDMEILNISYNAAQPTEFKEWNASSEFNEGIYDNITSTNVSYPGTLILSNGNSTGEWYSEIIEFNGSIDFQFINASTIVPGGSFVGIQLRSAKNKTALTGPFLGPDGTSGSSYLLFPEIINPVHDNDSVVQVRVFMDRGASVIPEVEWIEIHYAYTNVLEINVRNTGKIPIDTDTLDFFVSEQRISRDNVFRTDVIDATDITNPGIWEPEEELTIKISEVISPGMKMLTMVNEFSTKEYKKMII
jgi:hypothetical protein